MAAPEHAKLYTKIASVQDVAAGAGVWYVLDEVTPTVHMLDAGGAWLGNFGRAGEGPGELLRPWQLRSAATPSQWLTQDGEGYTYMDQTVAIETTGGSKPPVVKRPGPWTS